MLPFLLAYFRENMLPFLLAYFRVSHLGIIEDTSAMEGGSVCWVGFLRDLKGPRKSEGLGLSG